MESITIICKDPLIRLLLKSLVSNSLTSNWFKGVDDLMLDFNTDIKKQFPRIRFL